MSSARRLWSPEEDEQLRLLVSFWGDQCGKNGNWDKICANFEHRSAKDCRKRWFHSLDPKLKRGRWSESEDNVLMEAYARLGPSWQRISQLIPGRTDDQCSKRYNDVLDPSAAERLREWTPQEDSKLMELIEQYGTKWREICRHMEGRTGLTCRNRWRKLKKQEDLKQESLSQSVGDFQESPNVITPQQAPPQIGRQLQPQSSQQQQPQSQTTLQPGASIPVSAQNDQIRPPNPNFNPTGDPTSGAATTAPENGDAGPGSAIGSLPNGRTSTQNSQANVHYTFNYQQPDNYDQPMPSQLRQYPIGEAELMRILQFCRENDQKIVIHQHIYNQPPQHGNPTINLQPSAGLPQPSLLAQLPPKFSSEFGSPQPDDMFMGSGTFGGMDYLAFNPS